MLGALRMGMQCHKFLAFLERNLDRIAIKYCFGFFPIHILRKLLQCNVNNFDCHAYCTLAHTSHRCNF